jgi:adenylate kinase
MQPKVFVFMGKSGSGKGTQAELLKEYLEKHDSRKVLYLETGVALRQLSERGSHTAKLLEHAMDAGDLIPIFLPVWAWTSFLVDNYTREEHVIFDGLARRQAEAPILDSAMEFYGVEHVNIVYINVSDEWAHERLVGRGRGDDHEAEIKKRLAWFAENTVPALEYFKQYERGHYHEVNGEQTIPEVHDEVMAKLGFS